jgi:hypothetical protein
VSKGLWVIIVMGFLTITLLVVGMMMSLTQFQAASPAVKFVKLAEQISHEFKLEPVAAEVRLQPPPGALRVTYLTRVDTKFDITAQNAEMKKIAEFAIKNYQGNDRNWISDIQIQRSETHGSGCFQQTYVANFTLPNPYRGNRNNPDSPGAPMVSPRDK